MSLSASQIEQFRTDGMVFVPEFWTSEEIRAMRRELDRLVAAGMLRNVKTEGDGKSTSKVLQNLQICPIGSQSPLFRAAAFAPKVIEAVTELIGEPVIEHLDQIFLKPARTGAPTNWHQDNAYFKIADPMMGVGMWNAIHDANEANGTMRLIPGSHREVFEHTRDPDSDHHIRCYPPEDRAVFANLPAGGCAFFCYGIAHATGFNRTDADRAGLAMHFLRGDFAAAELLEADRDCRPWLTGPKATGGEREYGTRVAGTWADEVRRLG